MTRSRQYGAECLVRVAARTGRPRVCRHHLVVVPAYDGHHRRTDEDANDGAERPSVWQERRTGHNERAPAHIHHVVGEYARKEAPVAPAVRRDVLPLPWKLVEVDDQVDHHSQEGNRGIYVVLHGLVVSR